MSNCEKLYHHLCKRVFDQFAIVITTDWENRVLSGEHDVPLPDKNIYLEETK